MKSRMVLKILELGYSVLLSDVDVYWFGNPLPLLCSYGPAVLAAQSDEFKNIGAYFSVFLCALPFFFVSGI